MQRKQPNQSERMPSGLRSGTACGENASPGGSKTICVRFCQDMLPGRASLRSGESRRLRMHMKILFVRGWIQYARQKAEYVWISRWNCNFTIDKRRKRRMIYIGIDAIRNKVKILKNDTVLDILIIIILMLVIVYSFNINIFEVIGG